MRTEIRLAVVNMPVRSGQIAQNRQVMLDYLEEAAQAGAELVLFPELCLQGYDFYSDPTVTLAEKLAASESLSGPSCQLFTEAAQRLGLYLLFGMAQRDDADPSRLYNAAVAIDAQGNCQAYQKIHPYAEENEIFTKGQQPLALDSPWGPLGIGICYDTYQFPELMRYYTHLGSRLYLNLTALSEQTELPGSRQAFLRYYQPTLEYGVLANTIYIASANLTGRDTLRDYGGGSCILGPKQTPFIETDVAYYAGDANQTAPGIALATLDLSLATRRLSQPNPHAGGEPDFRPELYSQWFASLK